MASDDERFVAETLTARKAELIEILRNNTIGRLLFPVETSLSPAQSIYEFYKMAEKDATQYNYELVTPNYSQFSSQRTPKAIPLVQGDMSFTRHEAELAAKDLFTLMRRRDMLMEQLVVKEDRILIFGDTATGITSFADETYNVTDMTTELDLTSYSTAKTTFETAITEARTDLKDRAYDRSEKHVLWTPDVDGRARGCLATYDEKWSAYDEIGRLLARENKVNTNGWEFIHYSGYLGSATGAGTTNCAFICKHPMNFVAVASPVESPVAVHEITGVSYQIDWRVAPVFFRTEAVHYGDTVDITP